MANITLYHNKTVGNAPSREYQNGDVLQMVFNYTDDREDLWAVLDSAFEIGNVPVRVLGDEVNSRFNRKNIRVLYVGDVIGVDDRLYTVDSLGFSELIYPTVTFDSCVKRELPRDVSMMY